MARTVRDAKIDTRSARLKLVQRREPYWTVISAGCALGYRRGAKGGSWVARFRDETGCQHYEGLGAADDARDADGLSVYSFGQAQERARTFFAHCAQQQADGVSSSGPYLVETALDDYFKAAEKRGKKVSAARSAAVVHIRPTLGSVQVAKLTAKRLREWHCGIVEKPRHTRGKRGAAPQRAKKQGEGADGLRKRRATANRVLTVLKAALNYAWREGIVPTDTAWRRVAPFRAVSLPVIRYLGEDEMRRLVNACSPDFRHLVRGALLTGCRYGELVAAQVADFSSDVGILTVRFSKSGKARHVVLTDEGCAVFDALTAGKESQARIFVRSDGQPWGASHQQRPLFEACAKAGIAPAISFHILRHTYASVLAMRGVPMGVIAAQLGHADTRMTEKHYAHLAPNYIAATVRAHFPELGIADEYKVTSLGNTRQARQRRAATSGIIVSAMPALTD